MKARKVCPSCHEAKDVAAFGKDKQKLDGLYSYCRDCANLKAAIYRHKNPEKNAERVKESNQRALASGKAYERTKRMNKKFPDKLKARAKLAYAVKTGQITKKPCEVCGATKVHGHHPDYSKPLEVQWLCAKHHGRERIKHDLSKLNICVQE